MKIKIEIVIDAIETASECFTSYFDTITGNVVYLLDPYITGETDNELAELIENTPKRYLRFPIKYEIHEYSIMCAFIKTLPDRAVSQELIDVIQGRGAFHRFKQTIRYHGITQQWFVFRRKAYQEIAIRWCEKNNVEYE